MSIQANKWWCKNCGKEYDGAGNPAYCSYCQKSAFTTRRPWTNMSENEYMVAVQSKQAFESNAAPVSMPQFQPPQTQFVIKEEEGWSVWRLLLTLAVAATVLVLAVYNIPEFGNTPFGLSVKSIFENKVVPFVESITNPTSVSGPGNVPGKTTELPKPEIWGGCELRNASDVTRVDIFKVEFEKNHPSFIDDNGAPRSNVPKFGQKEYLLVCFDPGLMGPWVKAGNNASSMARLLDPTRVDMLEKIIKGETLGKGYWLFSNNLPTPTAFQPVQNTAQSASKTPTLVAPTKAQAKVVIDLPTAIPVTRMPMVPTSYKAPTKSVAQKTQAATEIVSMCGDRYIGVVKWEDLPKQAFWSEIQVLELKYLDVDKVSAWSEPYAPGKYKVCIGQILGLPDLKNIDGKGSVWSGSQVRVKPLYAGHDPATGLACLKVDVCEQKLTNGLYVFIVKPGPGLLPANPTPIPSATPLPSLGGITVLGLRDMYLQYQWSGSMSSTTLPTTSNPVVRMEYPWTPIVYDVDFTTFMGNIVQGQTVKIGRCDLMTAPMLKIGTGGPYGTYEVCIWPFQ